MVPQGIRPVVQLTAVEVTSCLSTPFLLVQPTPTPSICCVCSDPSLGLEEHEDVSAGRSVLAQPGGGVRWAAGGVGRHQEHEEEPELPQLCPLHQSGNGGLHVNLWPKVKGGKIVSSPCLLLCRPPTSYCQRMRCTRLPSC